eukprot:3006914-Rhodomonas_salina.2
MFHEVSSYAMSGNLQYGLTNRPSTPFLLSYPIPVPPYMPDCHSLCMLLLLRSLCDVQCCHSLSWAPFLALDSRCAGTEIGYALYLTCYAMCGAEIGDTAPRRKGWLSQLRSS